MVKVVGVDYIVFVKSRDGQEVVRQIEEVMGQKLEIIIECSGVLLSIQIVIYVCFYFCLKYKIFIFLFKF